MRQFEVIVEPQSVVVHELDNPLNMYDVSASVDGEIWRYRIKKNVGETLNKHWPERGYTQAHYHANNGGKFVKFDVVYHVKPKRKSKRHPNQIELF